MSSLFEFEFTIQHVKIQLFKNLHWKSSFH